MCSASVAPRTVGGVLTSLIWKVPANDVLGTIVSENLSNVRRRPVIGGGQKEMASFQFEWAIAAKQLEGEVVDHERRVIKNKPGDATYTIVSGR